MVATQPITTTLWCRSGSKTGGASSIRLLHKKYNGWKFWKEETFLYCLKKVRSIFIQYFERYVWLCSSSKPGWAGIHRLDTLWFTTLSLEYWQNGVKLLSTRAARVSKHFRRGAVYPWKSWWTKEYSEGAKTCLRNSLYAGHIFLEVQLKRSGIC